MSKVWAQGPPTEVKSPPGAPWPKSWIRTWIQKEEYLHSVQLRFGQKTTAVLRRPSGDLYAYCAKRKRKCLSVKTVQIALNPGWEIQLFFIFPCRFRVWLGFSTEAPQSTPWCPMRKSAQSYESRWQTQRCTPNKCRILGCTFCVHEEKNFKMWSHSGALFSFLAKYIFRKQFSAFYLSTSDVCLLLFCFVLATPLRKCCLNFYREKQHKKGADPLVKNSQFLLLQRFVTQFRQVDNPSVPPPICPTKNTHRSTQNLISHGSKIKCCHQVLGRTNMLHCIFRSADAVLGYRSSWPACKPFVIAKIFYPKSHTHTHTGKGIFIDTPPCLKRQGLLFAGCMEASNWWTSFLVLWKVGSYFKHLTKNLQSINCLWSPSVLFLFIFFLCQILQQNCNCIAGSGAKSFFYEAHALLLENNILHVMNRCTSLLLLSSHQSHDQHL